jgi:eukaryotic-like serine/threonine-protein kinase
MEDKNDERPSFNGHGTGQRESPKAEALRVLSSVSGQVPPEALARMLHDAEWQVREAAALTVEERGEQASPEPLGTRMRNEDVVEDEAAQKARKPSQREVLPLVSPALPLMVQRAMQAEVLGERYELQVPIGRGGMATIYRGRDMRMDRVVAIKVLREVYNTDPKFVTRFQREAKAASALRHPNIVQVFDYGQSDGTYYIVMELVEGTDLRRYLRSRGVLDSTRAIIIAHDIALGLGAAHRRGIVHRDVKPQNIMVGRGGSIRLTDFGIVSVYKDIDAFRLTTTGMTLGTVQYMPPEQVQGEIVSPAADVYALGIVMYEMLTGHLPFDGLSPVVVAMQHIQDAPTPPSQFNPNIPPALEEVILRCLEKVPEMRYRDGSQLARALESLGDAEFADTVHSTPGSQSAPGRIPARPASSGHAPTQDRQVSTSPPNHMLPISGTSDHNRACSSPVPLGASQLPRSLEQQPYVPPVMPPIGPAEPGSTRSYARGGALPHGRRDSRFAARVTALILLATLLLMGFSIYLAARLGFLTLPFLNTGAGTPTQTILTNKVPDLRGKDFTTAKTLATNAGFTLTPAPGSTQEGIVASQSPDPNAFLAKGDPIVVTMTTTTIVPALKQGATLEEVEQLITAADLQWQTQSVGKDSTLPPNAVSGLNPPSGTTVKLKTLVTIYVKNLDATPSPSPGPTPTPT